jgi:hypothetical protein
VDYSWSKAHPAQCRNGSYSVEMQHILAFPCNAPCHDRFLSRGMSSTRMFICGVNIIRNLSCRSLIHGHATIVVYNLSTSDHALSIGKNPERDTADCHFAFCTCRLLRQTRYFVNLSSIIGQNGSSSSTIEVAIPGLDMRGDKVQTKYCTRLEGSTADANHRLQRRVKIHESRPDQFLRSLPGSFIRTIPISPLLSSPSPVPSPQSPFACVRSKAKSPFCITSTSTP